MCPRSMVGRVSGLSELAVVLEELGYALFPGPVLPTVLAAAVISRQPSADQRARYLPGSGGRVRARLRSRSAPGHCACRDGPGGPTVSGTLRPVLGLPTASVSARPLGGRGLVPARPDEWHRGDVAARTRCHPAPGSGRLHRRPARARTHCCPSLASADVRDLALVMAAAEGAGVARWCLDTASEYAKVRVQFGRPIGQFQAIKHALADMLVAVEQCAAVAWDAAAAWSGERRERRARAERTGSGSLDPRCGGALRQAVRPGPRGHRVHLGARRALLSQAGHGDPPASGRRRGSRATAWPSWPSPGPGAASRPISLQRRGAQAVHCGPWCSGWQPNTVRPSAPRWSRRGCSCRTGRRRGAARPIRWTNW